ncbi:SDR family NAD(P)-dependent oxidoreductase [Streptomyces sp. NPDC003247]|uniref:SDR family NAD(P)-dependent oxidoreductase n=1 Tax=Streptomyces sp. NPDC003247 TaxID=3364677 RepID=UPI0036B695FC
MSGLRELAGKVAVVTGGASGIGRGIAEHLRDVGMRVVISDIEQESLRRTCDELGIEGVRADVTKEADVHALADAVVERHGAVHLAVNNAGVGSMGRIAGLRVADWRWMIDVNLFGVIHGITAFLPLLKANPDGGHMVNTASMSGLDANPGMGAYTASKFAVVGLTEVLAKELAEEGSRVGATVLCPGPVKSNIKNSLRTRPGGERGGLFDVDAAVEGPLAAMRWLEPVEVGRLVEHAVRSGDLYAVTHPELWLMVAQRHAGIERAFRSGGTD